MKKHLLVLLLLIGLYLPTQAQHYISVKSTQQLKTFLRYTPDRMPLISAHRGGPAVGYPENCIATFEHTLLHTPAIIELDPQLTKDGVAVLLHDDRLDRTTTGTGLVTDYTYKELKELKLKDLNGNITDYTIPTLEEAIKWAKGKAILSIDIKKSISPAVIEALIRKHKAESYSTVISYNLQTAQQYYALNPKLIISVSVSSLNAFNRLTESGIPFENMIAFTGVSEPEQAVFKALHDKGVMCILGTMGNLDKKHAARTHNVYAELVNNGADVLATDTPLAAAEALVSLIPANSPQKQYIKTVNPKKTPKMN